MDNDKSEHEIVAFEKFWSWKDNEGIGEDQEDWMPWWECFWAGYKDAVRTPMVKENSQLISDANNYLSGGGCGATSVQKAAELYRGMKKEA